MGFAQKLGEFAEGFTEGLLPGVKTGAALADAKQRRTAAATREKRMAGQAERAMIWNMAKIDPFGAAARAEALGDVALASSLRSFATKGVQTDFAGSLQAANVGAPPTIDFSSAEGIIDGIAATRSYQDKVRAGAGGITTSLASMPTGAEGLVDTGPMTARLEELDSYLAKSTGTINALSLMLKQTSNLNYNDPEYEETIEGIVNSYVSATGRKPEGNAIRRDLKQQAREQQTKVWTPLINALKGDVEGLEQVLTEPIVIRNPELVNRASLLLESAKRTAGLTDPEKEANDRLRRQAEMLEEQGDRNSITNPAVARKSYLAAIDIYGQLGHPPETLNILKAGVDGKIAEAGRKNRSDLAKSILEGAGTAAANTYGDKKKAVADYLKALGSTYGIAIPDTIDLSTVSGQAKVDDILDAQLNVIAGMVAPDAEPSSPTDVESEDETRAIVKLLEEGRVEEASAFWAEWLTTAPPEQVEQMIVALRAKQWEVVEHPALGITFRKIQLLPVQPNTAALDTAATTTPQTATPVATEAKNSTPGFLPFMPRY